MRTDTNNYVWSLTWQVINSNADISALPGKTAILDQNSNRKELLVITQVATIEAEIDHTILKYQMARKRLQESMTWDSIRESGSRVFGNFQKLKFYTLTEFLTLKQFLLVKREERDNSEVRQVTLK